MGWLLEVNLQDTRASSGYALRGIATHETLCTPRKAAHHEVRYDGGLSFVAAVLLMVAGAAGTVACVEVLRLVWML